MSLKNSLFAQPKGLASTMLIDVNVFFIIDI